MYKYAVYKYVAFNAATELSVSMECYHGCHILENVLTFLNVLRVFMKRGKERDLHNEKKYIENV